MPALRVVAAASETDPTFSWTNLLILLALAVVVVPLYRMVSVRLSQRRRERWAREEGWVDGEPPTT